MIDIPEDVYTRLFDNGIQDNEMSVDDVCEMARALRLGAPLPKGHGRLIDLDALDKDFSKCACKSDCGFLICPVYNQKIIIEADKEE